MTPSPPARILLVDDQAMVRTGFHMVIGPQRDLQVVGEASDGQHAIHQVRQLRPDVIVMDVRMPHVDGIEATQQIIRIAPTTKVLILTTFDLDDYVIEALNAGASGFLLKDAAASELLAAIRSIHRGDSVVAPAATRRLLQRVLPLRKPRSHPAPHTLTERETEVLTQIALGKSNTEIAKQLYLAESTIKTHVNRILAKLNARDRVQLVIYAYETGMVTPNPTSHESTREATHPTGSSTTTRD